MTAQSATTAPCCPEGSMGMAKKHPEGTGTWITAEGRNGRQDLEFYVAGGGGSGSGAASDTTIASAERLVVIFSDVYGVRTGNHRVFADTLANKLSEQGVKTCVVIPDLFRGNPALQPWFGDKIGRLGTYLGFPKMVYRLKRLYNAEETVDQDILQLVVPFLKSQNPTMDGISIVGFCYGGWIVPKFLEKANGYVKSAVAIHPGWNAEKQVYGKDQDGTDLAKACGSTPLLLMPCGNDHPLHKPGSEALAILSQARGGIPETEISMEFPTMKHGFVARGDPSKEDVRREQEKATRLCIDFIKKHDCK